jgi:diguanylate cyclase (GGDEF)-like protein
MLEAVANRVASSVALGRRVRQLETQAFNDALTGLANRALFMDRLEHALAVLSRTAAKVGVVFLDLDDFKTVNDGLGHAAGDELLRLVARRLETAVRAGDTVARLGGDEFAVLLEPVGNADDALAAADRLIAALAEPFQLGSRQVTVRASLGVAIDDTTAGELLRDADVAMYRAKNDGRGRAVLFESSMRDAAIARLDLERELRVAIEKGHLFLDYQPVFDVASRVVTGVEALVRWRHATRGTLMPGSFIDLAEETGLIVPLGRQVLRIACADARSWQAGSAVPFLVSVNLSVRQLEDPGIVEDVREALATSGLEPGRLILEITESAFARNREGVIAAVSALRGLGVRIAIDDFGIGYSSLSFVKDLPLDILKVDRSFIADLPDVGVRAGVVETFFRLGQVLGLQTVAEGVETEGQLSAVQELGADLVQGYLLGRPMPPDAIARILSAT